MTNAMAPHTNDSFSERSAIVAPATPSTDSPSPSESRNKKKVTKRIRKGLHKLGKSTHKLGKSSRRLLTRRANSRSTQPSLADVDLTSDADASSSRTHDESASKVTFLPFSSLVIPPQQMCQLKCKPNTYSDVPASQITVRGPHYLEGKNGVAPSSTSKKEALKVSSQESAYECVGFHIFRSNHHDLLHVASKAQSLKTFLAREHIKTQNEKRTHSISSMGDDKDVLVDFPEFLVTSFALSAMFKKDFTAVVQVFRIRPEIVRQDPAFRTAFTRFMNADNKAKNQKLKFKSVVHDAPGSVKRTVAMVGGERPALIGKKLRTTYERGPNYLEVDMDVGSSTMAKMLNSVVLKSCGGIMLDFHYILEAQSTDELPERVLGGVRVNYVDVNKVSVNLDAEGHAINPAQQHISTSSNTTSRAKRSSTERRPSRSMSGASQRGSVAEEGEGGFLESVSWMWAQTAQAVVSGFEVIGTAVGSVLPPFSDTSELRESMSSEDDDLSSREFATTSDL